MTDHPDLHNHHADCGHCGACKWWQSDPDAPGHEALGLCQQPEVVHFQLQVSDTSGCNRFEHAEALAGADRLSRQGGPG